jgi:predicted small secreted protein
MMRKAILALVVGSIALGTTACNTTRGAAADIESTANTVDEAT